LLLINNEQRNLPGKKHPSFITQQEIHLETSDDCWCLSDHNHTTIPTDSSTNLPSIQPQNNLIDDLRNVLRQDQCE
jgi:hypothetical protein